MKTNTLNLVKLDDTLSMGRKSFDPCPVHHLTAGHRAPAVKAPAVKAKSAKKAPKAKVKSKAAIKVPALDVSPSTATVSPA